MDELKQLLQNRRNVATLLGLLVMVALLPLGLYLGQLQQIFFSRASGTLIQLGEGNCVTTDSDGKKALKCGTVPLVLYNPFRATPTPSPTPTPAAPTPTPGVACQPRPDIVKPTVMTAQGLQVTFSAGTNVNTPTNSMKRIDITSLNNGTVNQGSTVYTQPSSYTVPAGTTQVPLLIKQVTKGQETTIGFNIVDDCGNFSTLIGGGTGAGWP